MVTRAVLAKHGVTAEAWKAKLAESSRASSQEADVRKPITDATPNEKIARLQRRIQSRVRRGRDYNLLNYRTVKALNLIWDTAFRQTSPTLMADIMRKYDSSKGEAAEKELLDALHAANLRSDDILWDSGEVDVKTGKPIKKLNAPAFYNIALPYVRSMIEARRAKIVNDRNVRPHHKFESPVSSPEQRVKCEALTSRVEVMWQQYDYLSTLKQAVLQMLVFGTCLQFTREAWHSETQLRVAGKDDLKRTVGDPPKPVALGDEIEYTSKEGLRYFHGDPARTFWDMAYPCHTFNSDVGCEYAGTWRVIRFGEILDNPTWYNKDRVCYGGEAGAWWSNSTDFFNSVYGSAVMDWPSTTTADGADREQSMLSAATYSASMPDKAVVITEYWEKIIPADYDLGDYKYPIWARFVLAGDNATILYAEPLCYQGVIAYRYNGDDRKTEDASMALILTPFQDMASNLLTQYILAVKQNLTNITLVDKNALEDGVWDKIKNLGERFYRVINIFKYDSKTLQRMQVSLPQAFYSHRFPMLDTNGILQSIKLVIELSDRMVQFSAQEIAQAASHEQTKREMEVISASTSNILQFTGTCVDVALATQARQLYEALMAHGDDDFWAQIPQDHGIDRTQLEAMGITYVFDPSTKDQRALVKVRKSAVDQLFFSVVPSWWERRNNADEARVIVEWFRDWFINNPRLDIGPDQTVEVANLVATRLLNLPLDHPIRNVGLSTPEQKAQAQAETQALQQSLMTEIKKGIMPLAKEVSALTTAVQWIYQQTNLPPPPEMQGGQPQPQPNANPNPAPAMEPSAVQNLPGMVAPQ